MAKLLQQTGTHKTTSGKSRQLEIDPEGYHLIMSFLTRAYTDPAEAVGREYTTNAIDANKLTGKGPARVTLPTRWNAEFIVEDDGPGMSEQELDDVFRKYTASSKRNSNDQTGMFGIGSKSALAYADMFTLVSIHDGRKVAITVSRNEEGGGVMDEMIAEDVDEDSGVVVRVPVHDVEGFNASVKKYFTEVPPGLVVVRNGTDGEYEDPSQLEKVIDGIWVKRRTGDVSRLAYGNPKMLMGNVSYPVDDEHQLPHTSKQVFFEVDLGEYQPLPSRESIEWNKASKEKFKKEMLSAYTDLIEAFKEDPGLYYKYHRLLGTNNYQIKRFFPQDHKYSDFNTHDVFKDMQVKGVDYVFNEEEKKLNSITDLNRGVVVVCPTEDDIPSRAKRRRLAQVFTDTPTGTMSNWIVKSKLTDQIKNTFTLQEVEHKAKKENGGVSKRVPNWDVVDDQYWKWRDKIPYNITRQVPFNQDLGDQQIVFFTRDDVVKDYHPHDRNVPPRKQLMRKCMDLAAKDSDVLLVRRQANHVEATRRDFPESMSLYEWFLDTLHSSRNDMYMGFTINRYGNTLSSGTFTKTELKTQATQENIHFFSAEADEDGFSFKNVEKKMRNLQVGQTDEDVRYWIIFTHEQMKDNNGDEIFKDIDEFLKERSNQYKQTIETVTVFKVLEHITCEWFFDLAFLLQSDDIAKHYKKLDLPHNSQYSSDTHSRLNSVYDQVKDIVVPEGKDTLTVEDRKNSLLADLLAILPFISFINTRALTRTANRHNNWYVPVTLRNLAESDAGFDVQVNGRQATEDFESFLETKKDDVIECFETHMENWKPLDNKSS